MPTVAQKDKRKAPRVGLRNGFVLISPDERGLGPQNICGVCHDISALGIKIICGHRCPPGSTLAVQLISSDRDLILSISAKVVRCIEEGQGIYHVACEFFNPCDFEKMRIGEYIKSIKSTQI